MKLIREFDEFDWIRGVPDHIPFYDVEIGATYRIETTNLFEKAIRNCNSPRLIGSNNALVNSKSETTSRSGVFCDDSGRGHVKSIYVGLSIDDHHRGWFYVTEEMVKFYPMEGTTINESDGLEWIRDTNPPNIRPNNSYIVNSQYVNQFLETLEDVLPKVRWISGSKPTEFDPLQNVSTTKNLMSIYIRFNIEQVLKMSYGEYNTDTEMLPKDGERNTSHWPNTYINDYE